MSIDQWLIGVEDLVVRTPGLLARMVEPNEEVCKASRFYYDFFDAEVDVAEFLPFVVIRERELAWVSEGDTNDVLYSEPVITVGYAEAVKWTDDHKRSKLDFVAWQGVMLGHIAAQQNRPMYDQPLTSHLPVSRIQVTVPATRSRPYREDPNIAGTAYWWTEFVLHIGDR
jgi:hypothetical protein